MTAILRASGIRAMILRGLSLAVLLSTTLSLVAESRGMQLQTVTSASVDSSGGIRVITGGRRVVIKKEKGQESVEPPVIADDRRTVGWLVNFPNCCTSYPIPMAVVVYRDGHILDRLTNGRAIWRWRFLKGGEQIAYFNDTVHGNSDPECTLVDLASGKTLQKWSRGDGSLPAWAESFAQDVGSIEAIP